MTDFGGNTRVREKIIQDLHIQAPNRPFLRFDPPLLARSVDYIFFITADVDLQVNPNECSDVAWVSPSELEEMIADPSMSCRSSISTFQPGHDETFTDNFYAPCVFIDSANSFTPWFELIVKRFLKSWWKSLLDQSPTNQVDASVLANSQDSVIHRMSDPKPIIDGRPETDPQPPSVELVVA